MSDAQRCDAEEPDAAPSNIAPLVRTSVRRWCSLLSDAAAHFMADRARRLSAGLAYYALFALVPTMLLAIAVAAAFVGREAAAGELEAQLTTLLGPEAAAAVQDAMGALWESGQDSNFAILGVLVVIFSSSILFVAWRDILELVWNVPYEPGIRNTVVARAMGALVPVIAGLLLTITLFLQTAVTFVQELVSTGLIDAALRAAGAASQSLIGILTIAVLYRYSVRRDRPSWRQVFPASALVALAFAVALWAYGIYLRTIGTSSVTGAAGSVVLGLVIVYYASQGLLFGAELIKVASGGSGMLRRRASSETN